MTFTLFKPQSLMMTHGLGQQTLVFVNPTLTIDASLPCLYLIQLCWLTGLNDNGLLYRFIELCDNRNDTIQGKNCIFIGLIDKTALICMDVNIAILGYL